MKTYTLSLGQSINYQHPAPERTAMQPLGWDYRYQVWPNRESMARSIRMQQKREPRQKDWKALVKLSDGEGY
jgi:hypothetical protein